MKNKIILFSILLIFCALYATIAIVNHYNFRTIGMDYGSYTQAFWEFAHFRMTDQPAVASDVAPGTFFAKHFTLTLIILVPLYWLFNWLTGTYTLLLIQVGFIVLGGWGTFKYVQFKTDKYWLGILAMIHYFMLLGHFTLNTLDYTDTTIGAAVVPFILLFFEKKQYWLTAIATLFVLVAKENMAIWLSLIFIALTILNYKDKKAVKAGIIFFVSCVVYFVMIFSVLIPYIQSLSGVKYAYDGFQYSELWGNTPYEAIVNIIKNPFKAIKYLFISHSPNPIGELIKLEFYKVYLISGAFVLLFRPVWLLMFLPILAQKMWSNDASIWSIELHYSVEFVSLLSAAIFVILAQSIKSNLRLTYIIGIGLVLTTSWITIHKLDKRHRAWAQWGLEKERFFDPVFFKSEVNAAEVHKLLKSHIPDNARVSVASKLVPHLAQRRFVYHFPFVRDAEYIALLSVSLWPQSYEEYDRTKRAYLNDSTHWEIKVNNEDLTILKRKNN